MLSQNSKNSFFIKCKSVSKEGIENAQRILGQSLLQLRYMEDGEHIERVSYEKLKQVEKLLKQAETELENIN